MCVSTDSVIFDKMVSSSNLKCKDAVKREMPDLNILVPAWRDRFEHLCDMTVVVGKTKFHCHRFVFFVRSKYFADICAQKKSASSIRVNLSNLPGGAETFELIAKFCYGQEVELKTSNIMNLEMAAVFLGMSSEAGVGTNLRGICDRFWTKKVFPFCNVIMDLLRAVKLVTFSEEILGVVHGCILALTSHVIKNETDSLYLDIPSLLKGLTNLQPNVLQLVIDNFREQGVTFINSASAIRSWLNSNMEVSNNQKSIELLIGFLIQQLYKVSHESITYHTCSAKAKASVLSKACSMSGIVKEEVNMLKSWYLYSIDEEDLLNLHIVTFSFLFLDSNINQTEERVCTKRANVAGKYLLRFSKNPVCSLPKFHVLVMSIAEVYLVHANRNPGYLPEIFREVVMNVAGILPSHDMLYDAVKAHVNYHADLGQQGKMLICNLVDGERLSSDKLEDALLSNFCLSTASLINLLKQERGIIGTSRTEEKSTDHWYTVFVKFDHDTGAFSVNSSYDVKKLKEDIRVRKGSMGELFSLKLRYNFRYLPDDLKLCDLNIGRDSTLYATYATSI